MAAWGDGQERLDPASAQASEGILSFPQSLELEEVNQAKRARGRENKEYTKEGRVEFMVRTVLMGTPGGCGGSEEKSQGQLGHFKSALERHANMDRGFVSYMGKWGGGGGSQR